MTEEEEGGRGSSTRRSVSGELLLTTVILNNIPFVMASTHAADLGKAHGARAVAGVRRGVQVR